ncbi:MAG: LytTR family DNA-binding domain-containing protein [Bacteroidota bacterium]
MPTDILIIEDELPASRRLSQLILECRPNAVISDVIDSVDAAVKWLRNFKSPQLIFMDIQLADGLSFDIFNQVDISSPVIFTTAYDQYTLKAFKVNSVDYLLKPIDPEELLAAFCKFEKVFQEPQRYDRNAIQELVTAMTQKAYKERFLVKMGQQLHYISTQEVAYFYSEDGMVHVKSRNSKQHIIDYTLDQLEEVLPPESFFRINRKIIIHIDSMKKIHTYFNSRLKLDLWPNTQLDAIVSRDRVGDFKRWLDK